MFNVLIIDSFHSVGMKMLRNRSDFKVMTVGAKDAKEIEKHIADTEIITVRTFGLTKELLGAAKNLRMVAKHGVGVNNIDTDFLKKKNIPVAVTATANAYSVAEHALAMMLGLAKKIIINDQAVRKGNFAIRESLNIHTLAGRSVLICGFGRIGRELAKLCNAFKMKVLVFDAYAKIDEKSGSFTQVADIHQALGQIDFVSLHMPLSEKTRNFFGEKEFAAMKNNAYLINAARGGVVDENALRQALANQKIAGAGLDVFENEPPDPDDPLLNLPGNVIVSPHNAAMTKEGAYNMAYETAKNVIDFAEGKLPPEVVVNQVDLEPV